MCSKDPSLDDAYALRTPEDSVRLYKDWAETYDGDFVVRMDYRIAKEVAAAFAGAGGVGPALDVGAGTGQVGVHLAACGVGPVDAADISAEMLEMARTKAVYRDIFTADITQRTKIADGSYRGVLSAGTFTHGHVGPEALDELLRVAAPGALVALSINAEHWESARFADKFAALQNRIRDLELAEVRIYGEGATGVHARDTAKIALFRKT